VTLDETPKKLESS